jgi:hypothetical protein
MDIDQNWYRQLLALVLLSAARGVVEWITNPRSRDDAAKQLRSSFAEIDYDAAAKAVTKVIETAAASSKERVNETIDALRDRSVDAVDDAKSKAEKQLGQKRGGRLRYFFLVALVAGAAYYLSDEQRRDALLDRLTGASGPIQQSAQSAYQQASSTAPQAADQTQQTVHEAAQQAADETQTSA